MSILISCFLIAVYGALAYIQTKKLTVGSDHAIHMCIIKEIKQTKNRFFRKFSCIINEHLVSYPTLLHWIFSFLPINVIGKLAKNINVLLAMSHIAIFIVFINKQQFLKLSELETFLAGLLMILQPFNFNPNNAKNIGFSARGFGLLFGHIYIYSLFLYVYSGLFSLILLAAFASLVILLSSQIATQFLIFSFPILFISQVILNQPLMLLPLPIALLAFWLLFPSVFLSYLKGQIEHKKVYFRFIAARSIFLVKQSLWLDLFNIIPRIIAFRLLGMNHRLKGSVLGHLEGNSLTLSVLQIPIIWLSVLCLFFVNDSDIWVFIVLGISLFFFTTFNKFRHLGEPERYLEFVSPISILLIVACAGNDIVIVILTYLFIYSTRLLYKSFNQSTIATPQVNIANALLAYLASIDNVRIVSADTQLAKFILTPELKSFYYLVNRLKTDCFFFEEVHSSNFGYLEPRTLPRIVKYYNLNYIVLPVGKEQAYFQYLNQSDIFFSEQKVFENQILLRVK